MGSIFLTQVGWPLKPIAWLLGVILNAIYEFVGFFGIHNIAICIILFTIVTKMLMLPLTIKQQKYSRLQSTMSPELTRINAKYKGKKDEESLRRMQAETQEVYAKYGTSPMGGCLPLLISLPIMFALYRVIYSIPAYVGDIGGLYNTVADSIIQVKDHATLITNFITENSIAVANELSTYAIGSPEYTNSLIDILANFNPSNWNALTAMPQFANLTTLVATEGTETVKVIGQIISANSMFGLSILDKPAWDSFSVLVPILAAASQFIQGKLQMSDTAKRNPVNSDTPMGNTSKTLTTIMPIMSGVFCLMFPIGVGLYWIASAVVQIFQQLFINRYLDKTGIDELIEKNVIKSNKKKAKMGIAPGTKMANVARTSTRTIDTSKPIVNTPKEVTTGNKRGSSTSYSSKSIAANANLLKNMNSNQKKNNNNKKPQNQENSKSNEGKIETNENDV